MTKEKALERVAALSSKVEKGELDLNTWKWQRAEAMAAAADAGATQREIGGVAGLSQSAVKVHLQVWAEYGTHSGRPSYSDAYDSVRGFDRDEAQARTDRARAKRVLQESSPAQVQELLQELPDEKVEGIRCAAHRENVKRWQKDYVESGGESTDESRRRADVEMNQRLRESPHLAMTHLGASMATLRANVRGFLQGYQDFLALVDDEEILEYARERMVGLAADVALAFDQAIEGSLEDQFASLLKGDEA